MKKSAVFLLHTGYWLCYLLLFAVLVLFLQGHFIFRGFNLVVFLTVFAFIPGIIGFYSFYTFLFTRLLKRKKIVALILSAIVVAAGCGLWGFLLLNLAWGHMVPNHKTPFKQDGYSEVIAITVIMSVNALLNGTVALVMRGFITWYADIKLKEELNKKNYEMELALIKSQINPHFLFNTINNIDVLIEKDSTKASVYLNKLSGILRFLLYETKTEKIPLIKELAYIEKYIDLQKIRTSNPDYIKYAVEGNAGNLMIEPMLFIPFIENAFKHAENKKAETSIDIRLAIENNMLVFNCENKYNAALSIKPDHGGLGNKLIQKRLALLYPGRHSLAITNKNGTYRVKLILSGHEN